jgi:hypothetical protein
MQRWRLGEGIAAPRRRAGLPVERDGLAALDARAHRPIICRMGATTIEQAFVHLRGGPPGTGIKLAQSAHWWFARSTCWGTHKQREIGTRRASQEEVVMFHSLAASLLSVWPLELIVVLAAVSIAMIKPESDSGADATRSF